MTSIGAQTALQNFTGILQGALGPELLGLYIYGSYVAGDFDSSRSDLDLLAVLAHKPTEVQLLRLQHAHDVFYRQYPAWRTRIDATYISRHALWDFKKEDGIAIATSGGEPLTFQTPAPHWLIDWYKTQVHGVVLAGPAISDFIPNISQQEFIETVKNYIYKWRHDCGGALTQGRQAYAVLSVCRSLYAFKHGQPVSKKLGSQWALHTYPQFTLLITESLARNRDKIADRTKDSNNQRKVQEFIDFAADMVKI